MTEGYRDFIEPDDPNTKVWRYMDFEKYVRMLQSGSLYFARLRQFDDPYEGSCLPFRILKPEFQHPEIDDSLKELIKDNFKQRNQDMAINCWHLNNYESAAMWKLYSNVGKGIAIQSTFARLKDTLSKTSFAKTICIDLGLVRYIDYCVEVFHKDGLTALFDGVMHKRKSFEHEREIRAVIYTANDFPNNTGFEVAVDLKSLVETVYVDPIADDWFAKLVEAETEKHGFSFKIIKSDLNNIPPY